MDGSAGYLDDWDTDGLVELQGAIEDSLRIMGQVAMPNFIAMLAEVLLIRGEHAPAFDEIERFLVATDTTRDRHFNAELHRLAAECHLALGEPEAADARWSTRSIRPALSGRSRSSCGLWARRAETDRARTLVHEVLDVLGEAPDKLTVHLCIMTLPTGGAICALVDAALRFRQIVLAFLQTPEVQC